MSYVCAWYAGRQNDSGWRIFTLKKQQAASRLTQPVKYTYRECGQFIFKCTQYKVLNWCVHFLSAVILGNFRNKSFDWWLVNSVCCLCDTGNMCNTGSQQSCQYEKVLSIWQLQQCQIHRRMLIWLNTLTFMTISEVCKQLLLHIESSSNLTAFDGNLLL